MRTPDLTQAHWTKSSHSGHDGGNCLELALAISGFAPVRDSKHTDGGPVIPFTRPAWAAFVSALVRS
ncbi:DUF397 domain-containing protein [Streptomyces albidoflavus]|uniref:DUF397 domain-containing protein n=1 Tax=Streptomyces albidoflavus TaxID=1886 RepID=UPI00386F4169|nr:DUF397 domain-containing protein [Streptomyces albidoflavus]WTC43351.1 DUF397 domain-containing protein [Streptomyces albidoflavus]WTD42227.1 DUF397 domain-containing protein [Streptomyces albidoflavus]WTD83497.1 DUF397 domain-containing protein [Streptomyces albidoflavus]